jgi:hypothetical protein
MKNESVFEAFEAPGTLTIKVVANDTPLNVAIETPSQTPSQTPATPQVTSERLVETGQGKEQVRSSMRT